MLTVGDPITTIHSNRFNNTPGPTVLNGQADMKGNEVFE
jgi:hypothetical protein